MQQVAQLSQRDRAAGWVSYGHVTPLSTCSFRLCRLFFSPFTSAPAHYRLCVYALYKSTIDWL